MIDLAQKVEFLSRPTSYFDADQVETRETHMSWVFLTQGFVYKLKKPLKLSYLDFSTTALRRYYCEEELRLNHRLAAQTYLDVLPLCTDALGNLALDGAGKVVEWLVKMRRLPDSEMLDQRIEQNAVSAADVDAIADMLIDFYEGQKPPPRDGTTYIDYLRREQAINREVLLRAEFGLAENATGPLDGTDRSLDALAPEIISRDHERNILEGHGDLRPEHVCLTQPLQIIDRLEFNPVMRIVDPYDEINYLGLECEILGAPWIRNRLLTALEAGIGKKPSDRLLSLYGAFRALLRARLSIAHLLEQPVRKPEKWRPLALRYLEFAHQQCISLRFPEGRKSIHAR